NPREIVQRTLDYEGPERVARSFGESDFAGAGNTVKTRATKWREVGGGRWERTDEWGNLWARVDATSKGEVAKGVLEDIKDMDAYEFPDYSNASDYEKTRKAREEHPDKWLIGGLPGFAFNIARKFRRLDQYLVDLLLEPEWCHELHDRIDAVLEDMIRNYAAAEVDAVMLVEDWGTQDRLMINPELWREEFGPRFEKLCGIAHECGARVFMHSCGQTEEIVPDLMRAGVDLPSGARSTSRPFYSPGTRR
ncbi:MAG: uroporphyrinogen decarboxylase family protein, partial [Planctomycetota bacterium]